MEGRVNERGKDKKRGALAKVAERAGAKKGGLFRNFLDEKFAEKAQMVGAYSAAFLAAFLVALVSASAFTPVDNSEAADKINVSYNGTGYYINMSATGNVNMSLDATPDGKVAVAKDTVNVKTNSPTYKIYVSMNSNTADTNKLYLNGSSSSSSYFNPTSGTADAPAALSTNTWGWALANSSISGYAFDSSYTVGNNVSASQKFAAMPILGSEALIASGNAPTTSGTDYDIYYGVKANTALTSGTYSNTVLYTAIGEASSSSSGEASISPEVQTTLDPDTASTYGKGQQVTVATSFYASPELDLGSVSVTIGGKECTGIQQSLSNTGTVNLSCYAPESLTWGTYDVVATFSKYDRSYTLDDAYNVYVPYATMKTAAAGTYTMQSFTRKTCDEAPTPKAYNTQDGTGSILNGDTINTDVPEVTLKDARNTSHEYRVRKLADGNCWMADNLRLTLSTSTPLTSETSDINYNMDTGYGVDGTTTTTRVISNNLQGTVDPLGTYSTDATTGVVSWTPFANSSTTLLVSWGSPYVDAEGTIATAGTSIRAGIKHFGLDGIVEETENASYFVNDNQFAEYARSYVRNATIIDGDNEAQHSGNYYNWYAVTAGSGTYALRSDDAKNSICPRNWQLPERDGDRSWYNLIYSNYKFTASGQVTGGYEEVLALKKAPFSIILAGWLHWSTGEHYNSGVHGLYWGSTASNTPPSAVFMYFYISSTSQGTGSVTTRDAGFANYGNSVRCVVR